MSPTPRILRTIDASVEETIAIRWWRVRLTGPTDPPTRMIEILTTHHTAPPDAVWVAKQGSSQ